MWHIIEWQTKGQIKERHPTLINRKKKGELLEGQYRQSVNTYIGTILQREVAEI